MSALRTPWLVVYGLLVLETTLTLPVLAAEPPTRATFSATVGLASATSNQGILTLSADIDPGWHVYALSEPAGGPTPLNVSLGAEAPGRLAGKPSGTTAKRHHDPGFDLDTSFYENQFQLHFPLVFPSGAPRAGDLVAVNVRFQACSDRECLPPRTVALNAAVGDPDGRHVHP